MKEPYIKFINGLDLPHPPPKSSNLMFLGTLKAFSEEAATDDTMEMYGTTAHTMVR